MSSSVTALTRVFIGTTSAPTATALATAREGLDGGPALPAALAAVWKPIFEADTYTEILPISDLGEFGSEAEVVVSKNISFPDARKFKGSRDNGTMNLVCERDALDPGQIALRAAEKTTFAYNIKVVLNDKPGADATSTVYYFQVIVGSAKDQFGGPDDITKTTFALAISGAIIQIPAALGPVVTMTPAAGALTAGEGDTAYAGVTIAASGGTGTASYSVTTGTLPAGLSLNSGTGVIDGTPTDAGTSNFTITATYTGAGSASAAYSITVA